MLIVTPSRLIDSRVASLPDWLDPKDVLVRNNTRVLSARLEGIRQRDDGATARIRASLLRKRDSGDWEALVRPLRRLRSGDTIRFGEQLSAQVVSVGAASATFRFDSGGRSLQEALASAGAMPLPPYIADRRPPDEQDCEDYQTVFASRPGAVAAPTAGLHFDPPLIDSIRAAGVETAEVTLHVGGGTFLPVRTPDLRDHVMHPEWGEVDAAACDRINAARERGGRVVAVGTTSLRLIESTTDEDGHCQPWRGDTDLFIHPGYRFRITDVLLTNFHLPRSTLFMLVCAFLGTDRMQEAYRHAIEAEYRFYSYGDACLLLRTE